VSNHLSYGMAPEFVILLVWLVLTTNNYDSLTELHTPKITVATAHTKSSQSALVIAW
jgi:hypothetical protein